MQGKQPRRDVDRRLIQGATGKCRIAGSRGFGQTHYGFSIAENHPYCNVICCSSAAANAVCDHIFYGGKLVRGDDQCLLLPAGRVRQERTGTPPWATSGCVGNSAISDFQLCPTLEAVKKPRTVLSRLEQQDDELKESASRHQAVEISAEVFRLLPEAFRLTRRRDVSLVVAT